MRNIAYHVLQCSALCKGVSIYVTAHIPAGNKGLEMLGKLLLRVLSGSLRKLMWNN